MEPRLNESELHVAAGLNHLSTRCISHLLSLMYSRSKCPSFLDDRDLPTRQFDKIKFKVIRPDVKKAFRSPNYLGSSPWDRLPADTQKSRTKSRFKCEVEKHVKNGLFDNVKI